MSRSLPFYLIKNSKQGKVYYVVYKKVFKVPLLTGLLSSSLNCKAAIVKLKEGRSDKQVIP
jgi:hypothetical protein